MAELWDWQREKQRARDKINNSIKAGKIERGRQCQMCGRHARTEGHHWDHLGHPAEIVWLCHSCHRLANKIQKEQQFDWEQASTVGIGTGKYE